KAGKEVLGLETPAFQMSLLSSVSQKFTDSFVKHNLQKAGQMIKNFNELVTAWKHGAAAVLESLLQKAMRKDSPGVYEKLVSDRNKKAMPPIEKPFSNAQTTWVLTGAGHMIRRKGVAAMLREAVYRVEQL